MILFNTVMQKEKLALATLVIIVIILLSSIIITSEDVFKNLFEEKKETIELGDCVDVNYIGKYTNGTVFDTTYEEVAQQWNISKYEYNPAKVFVTTNKSLSPPQGYEDYSSSNMVDGFIDGLIGLKEGDKATIGPIPPEKGYGILPEIGDTINVSSAENPDLNRELEFIDIIENASLPEEYRRSGFEEPTTLYVLKDNSPYLGEKLTLYPSWENASVVTKINETMIWIETTPPENKTTNFTWKEIDSSGYLVSYWENASTATMNATHIIVTHNPEINATLKLGYYTYTVVNLTDDKINVSYMGYDGNISYTTLDRKVIIKRNQTQEIVYHLPKEFLEYVLNFLKQIDPTIPYSVDEKAGKTLTYDVEIVKVYKTSSQLES